MHSFLKSKFQGFVHRGDASNYVENTLEAFKSAKSLGYHYIETDLRETKDGKVITFPVSYTHLTLPTTPYV